MCKILGPMGTIIFMHLKIRTVNFTLIDQSIVKTMFFHHLLSSGTNTCLFLFDRYKFDIVRSAWQRDLPAKEEDSNEFVSAVAWKPDCSVVVVANSQGIVKVLELV